MSSPLGLLSAFPAVRRSPVLATIAAALAGSVLITLGAKVQVPFWPVPMTLHTLAVFVVAATLGLRAGALAMAFYLLEGALGLPVFSGTPERGIGLAYMVGPTGGYLVGYLVAAAMIGFAADLGLRRRPVVLASVMLGALAVVYAVGAAWLARVTGWHQAMELGVAPFVVGDVVKIALASAIVAGASFGLRRAA